MSKRKSRARVRAVSVARTPWGGDHGPETQAATQGTAVRAIDGPNNMAQRYRRCSIEAMSLTMRQEQAAKAIRDAHCRVEMLSSGGPLKEWVQSFPKPDATVAVQCDANSAWVHVMARVLRSERDLVEAVCCHNVNINRAGRMGHVRASARFKTAMDRVADHLRY